MENLLQNEREKKSLSRKELAELVGCNEDVIADIEEIKIIPSISLMREIAFVLKVCPEQIFNMYF